MGNCCSSSKNEPEAFSRPGRVLGSNSNNNTTTGSQRVPVPASGFKSPGRVLGTTTAAAAPPSQKGTHQGGNNDDARAKARMAALARADASTTAANKGKLGTKLAAQKAQTQTQTLAEVSRTERAARDADNAHNARRWE